MKQYDAKKILNIALAGHSGCGKTSVAESILYLAKVSDRLGKIADGNTVLDYANCPEQFREVHFAKGEKRLRYELLKRNLLERFGG